MTDLELTKLCAQAIGYKPDVRAKYRGLGSEFSGIWVNDSSLTFDPLHDDAQAMALVQKFHVHLYWNAAASEPRWEAQSPGVIGFGSGHPYDQPEGLNRAIVECVAKMWKAKALA